MRTVLLKGEVPVSRRELDALRRRSAELDDYLAAIQSPAVRRVRQQAMTIGRAYAIGTGPQRQVGWAEGVMEYENALGDALVERMRSRP